MPSHAPTAPFLISPADTKLFPSAPFTFPMSNLDPSAFASKFNSKSTHIVKVLLADRAFNPIRKKDFMPNKATLHFYLVLNLR